MSRSRMEIGPSSPSIMSGVIFGNNNRAYRLQYGDALISLASRWWICSMSKLTFEASLSVGWKSNLTKLPRVQVEATLAFSQMDDKTDHQYFCRDSVLSIQYPDLHCCHGSKARLRSHDPFQTPPCSVTKKPVELKLSIGNSDTRAILARTLAVSSVKR
jgi:hypothetical protein